MEKRDEMAQTTAQMIAAYDAECIAHGERPYVPCDSRSPYYGEADLRCGFEAGHAGCCISTGDRWRTWWRPQPEARVGQAGRRERTMLDYIWLATLADELRKLSRSPELAGTRAVLELERLYAVVAQQADAARAEEGREQVKYPWVEFGPRPKCTRCGARLLDTLPADHVPTIPELIDLCNSFVGEHSSCGIEEVVA